jgi:uncharacterized membrane protein
VNHPLRIPVLALAFASLIGCAVLGTRVVITGQERHLYLPWNLFLAWLPLLFALAAEGLQQRGGERRWKFFAAAFAWLLFFPNAPYILTDLTHLRWQAHPHWWADLVLILLFALAGLVLGFLSLFLMQRLVAQRFGWRTGWLFVGAVAGLSGFGIYLGRFLRWNSWDLLIHPIGLCADVAHWLARVPARPRLAVLPALFATLLFLAYLMLYALTHLPRPLALPMETGPKSKT